MNSTLHKYPATAEETKIIIITVILSVFSAFGTTGNAFVLYIFSRKKEKNTSTIFILTLAMVDFLTCLVVIPFTIIVEYMEKRTNDDVACKIYSFLISCSVPFSAFIMVAIALDRYFCICRPWTRLLDTKSAKRIVFVLFLIVICLGITTSLAHGVYTVQTETVNKTNVDGTYLGANLSAAFNHTNLNKDDSYYNIISSNNSVTEVSDKYRAVDMKNISRFITFTRKKIVFTGVCLPNEILLGLGVRKMYQRFYISLFVIAFVSVSVLYALIYRSILTRRKRRLEASGIHKFFSHRKHTLISTLATSKPTEITEQTCVEEPLNNKKVHTKVAIHKGDEIDSENEDVEFRGENDIPMKEINTMTDDQAENEQESSLKAQNNKLSSKRSKSEQRKKGVKNCNSRVQLSEATKYNDKSCSNGVKEMCEVEGDVPDSAKAVTVYRQDTRKSVRERHRIANIKTAGILFTVTLVFILAFLPAWLMATQIIPADIVVFYMYFSYNVANPIIYAFFNKSFQQEMKNVLKCKRYNR